MKGQKRRMSAGYPPARPDNWPGGQYTNPSGWPQGWESWSVNSGRLAQRGSLRELGVSGRGHGKPA